MMAMKKLRALPSPFLPLSLCTLNARKAEMPEPSGVSSSGSQELRHLGWVEVSVALLVYLQRPPSPIRVQEGFTVRNYPGG